MKDKELTVSLSGNLGFVSLDEVLRLLTRSGQRGSVAVRGDGVTGRVYVTKSGISLATTMGDDGLRELLVKSGLGDPHGPQGTGSPGGADHELVELLREITVESIYRLNLYGDTFDVTEGEEARYASPQPFELEQLLEESRKRLEDWAEVSQVVSDLDSRIRFERDLGDREEVRIRRDAWRVLSEVGAGASVSEIADALGTTEFWAARIVARLVEEDLLRTESGASQEPAETDSWSAPGFEQPSVRREAIEEDSPRVEEPYQPDYGFGDQEPVEEPAAEDSWAGPASAPVAEDAWAGPASAPVAEEEPQTPGDAPQVDPDPNESWWQEPKSDAADEDEATDAPEGDVEEDTEAFLEKVFSELDTPSEDEDGSEDQDEGYGLLRRRRLGAMRDITSRDS